MQIVSPGSWTARVSDKSWIEVSPSSGNATTGSSVNIDLPHTNMGAARTGFIDFICNEIVYTVEITQPGLGIQ